MLTNPKPNTVSSRNFFDGETAQEGTSTLHSTLTLFAIGQSF
jgi:hypothetical protein